MLTRMLKNPGTVTAYSVETARVLREVEISIILWYIVLFGKSVHQIFECGTNAVQNIVQVYPPDHKGRACAQKNIMGFRPIWGRLFGKHEHFHAVPVK